jgi:hypothetical protein
MASIILVDVRPATLQATLQNLQVLKDQGKYLVGLEVLHRDVRALLGVNYDPQHTGGRSDTSAIAEVFCRIHEGAPIPQGNEVLVIEKPDADSVGAAALLQLKLEGGLRYRAGDPTEGETEFPYLDQPGLEDRVRLVDELDRHAMASAKAWSPEPLAAQLDRETPLGAILGLVADFKVGIEERVRLMAHCLLTGEEPANYRTAYTAERKAIESSLADGSTTVEMAHGGKVAVVTSGLRAGTRVGYSVAPVVIVTNGKGLVTICQHRAGLVDLKAVTAALNALEPGWGGSPTIVGSPKPAGTKMAIAAIVDLVGQHLLA